MVDQAPLVRRSTALVERLAPILAAVRVVDDRNRVVIDERVASCPRPLTALRAFSDHLVGQRVHAVSTLVGRGIVGIALDRGEGAASYAFLTPTSSTHAATASRRASSASRSRGGPRRTDSYRSFSA